MRARLKRIFIIGIYVVIDVFFIILAFQLVLLFRPHTVVFKVTSKFLFSASDPYRMLFMAWTMLTIFFHYTHGLYQTHREQQERREVWGVIKASCISTLFVIVLTFLLRVEDFPRSVMILNTVGIIFFSSIWRVIKKMVVGYLVSNGYNNFNTLIIGAGKTGLSLAGAIQEHPSLGLRIKGYLDDQKTGMCGNFPILGGLDSFTDVLEREFIQQVYITIYPQHQCFIKLLEIARERGVAVRVVPQGYEYMAQDFVKFNIGLIPVLEYTHLNVDYHQRIKRLFDFAAALLLVIFLWPLFCDPGCINQARQPRASSLFFPSLWLLWPHV